MLYLPLYSNQSTGLRDGKYILEAREIVELLFCCVPISKASETMAKVLAIKDYTLQYKPPYASLIAIDNTK